MSANPLSAIDAWGATTAEPRPFGARRAGTTDAPFAAHLAQASEARQAASDLVATALVQPVLAMLRDGVDTEGPFAPGAAERRFGPLLDQQIADRVTRSANFPLVDRIAEQLESAAARRTRRGVQA